MKSSILVLVLMTLTTNLGFAEVVQLPRASITTEMLNGDILLIKMKDYVMISGKESLILLKELGTEGKKNFTRDIVMTQSPRDLQLTYDPQNRRKMVRKIIKRYSEVLAKIEAEEGDDTVRPNLEPVIYGRDKS